VTDTRYRSTRSFRLAGPGKGCLGHHTVHGPADRDHVVCPEWASPTSAA
jgi:hypothetical protein